MSGKETSWAVALMVLGAVWFQSSGLANAGWTLSSEALAGATQETSGVASANEWCPVLPDETVDPAIFTRYQGRTVWLCCNKCLRQFNADPESFAANLPVSFSTIVSPQDHDDASEHAHDANSGQANEDGEEEAHDHSSHATGEGGLAALAGRIGRLHPMVRHFPIALLPTGALAELLADWRRSARLAFAARYSLWIAAPAALAAAFLGWLDAHEVSDSYNGFPGRLLFYHRWSGTLTALVALAALLVCERSYRKAATASPTGRRAMLLLAALLVTVTGHLGASLIFGWDYLLG